MGMTKLTLSADDDLIVRAKAFAAREGTSLSSMFSRFVESMLADRAEDVEIGPLTRKAMGLAKLPSGKRERDILEDALLEKYGL